MSSSYTIVTCDWEPNQTAMWRHYVEKNCPSAQIITVPDTKPVPHCWSGGKLSCFSPETVAQMDFPHRLVYMDTDTVVFEDLEPIFDLAGGNFIGSSLKIIPENMRRREEALYKKSQLSCGDGPYTHYPSGFLLFKDVRVNSIYNVWKYMLNNKTVISSFRQGLLFDEICLSLAMMSMGLVSKTWSIPFEIHGNLLSKREFGNADLPWVMHYHNLARLRRFKLEKYFIGGEQKLSRRAPVGR